MEDERKKKRNKKKKNKQTKTTEEEIDQSNHVSNTKLDPDTHHPKSNGVLPVSEFAFSFSFQLIGRNSFSLCYEMKNKKTNLIIRFVHSSLVMQMHGSLP